MDVRGPSILRVLVEGVASLLWLISPGLRYVIYYMHALFLSGAGGSTTGRTRVESGRHVKYF
jgi:hypothetical protein